MRLKDKRQASPNPSKEGKQFSPFGGVRGSLSPKFMSIFFCLKKKSIFF